MILNHLLYVDPGSGSYLLQVIIAAILGAGFVLKSWWWRIKAFFSSKKNSDADTTDRTETISEK